jgi:monothiol glutaredoxin
VSRAVFPDSHVHPAIRETVATNRREIVDAVKAAIAQHDLVVVGMAINPVPKRRARLLNAAASRTTTSEYGSYCRSGAAATR